MNSYQKILLLTICLLTIEKYTNSGRSYKKYSPPIKLDIAKKFKNKKFYKFFLATTTGNKIPLKNKTKAIFKRLSLFHLFTPSGIHLSSLMVLITPFLFLIKRFSRQFTYYISICIFLIPWSMSSLSSIKRICTLSLAGYILKNIFKLKLETKLLFVNIFFLDFLVGTYQLGHISFIYSFLFLGIIYFKNETKVPLIYLLFGGQLLLAFHWEQEINLLGPFLGFIFTAIFSYIFPIIMSFHIFSHIQNINYAEYLIEKLFYILERFDHLAISSGSLSLSIPIILCVIFLTTRWKSLIPVLIIFHSNIIL